MHASRPSVRPVALRHRLGLSVATIALLALPGGGVLAYTGTSADDSQTVTTSLTEDFTFLDGQDVLTVTDGGTLTGTIDFGTGSLDELNVQSGGGVVGSTVFNGSAKMNNAGTITGNVSALKSSFFAVNTGSVVGTVSFGLHTSTLTNSGVMDGNGGFAVLLKDSGQLTINNTGIIGSGSTVYNDVIYASSGLNGVLTVNNSGEIRGKIVTFASKLNVTNDGTIHRTIVGGSNADTFINRGTFTGAMMNGGDDTVILYDTGSSNFSVTGGNGNDALYLHGEGEGSLDLATHSGFETLTKQGTGMWTVNLSQVAFDSTPGAMRVEAGLLRLGDGLPIVTDVTLAGGSLEVAGALTGDVAGLANADAVTASGTITGDVALGSGDDRVTLRDGGGIGGAINGGDGTDTLTLAGTTGGTLNAASPFSFEVLSKVDSGSWTLSGTGTFAATAVAAGQLIVASGASITTDVTLTGGALDLAGSLVGSVIGSTGADTVTLHDGAGLTGTISGDDGLDTVVLRGTDSATLHLAKLSGIETLRKADAGEWLLTGNGAIATTEVTGGTLAVVANSALSGNVTLDGATLVVGGGLTGNVTGGAGADKVAFMGAGASFAGALDGGAGSDKLVLSGPVGAVNATALSGFEQLHKVAEGVAELSVGGMGAMSTLSTSAFSFSEGVTVEGGGLHLTGDWDQAGGLFTVTLVDPNTPKLEATGTATLDGGLKLVYDPATLAEGQSFTLVKAGAINGTFSSVDGGARVVFDPIAYTGTTATVTVQKIGTIGDALPTAPSGLSGVITVLDGLDASAVSPELQAVLTQLVPLGEAELQAAVADIGGAAVPVLAQATQALGNAGTGTAMGRLAALGAAPQSTVTAQAQPPVQLAFAGLEAGELVAQAEAAPEAAAGGRWAGWLQGYGSRGRIDAVGGAEGVEFAGGGALAGADALVAEGLRVGVSFGYGASGAETDGGDQADTRTLQAGTYGSYAQGPWRWAGALGVARHAVDTTRHVALTNETLTADYTAWEVAAEVEGGYRVDLGAATLTPTAGLALAVLRQPGYTESGSAALVLTVEDKTETAVDGRLGVTVARSFATGRGTLTPELRLGWTHAFGDTASSTTASLAGTPAWRVDGPELARDRFNLGAGATWSAGETLELFAGYDATLSADQNAHALHGGLRLRW